MAFLKSCSFAQLPNAPSCSRSRRSPTASPARARSRYIAFLREAYHHVKHTVPLLMACGSRLGDERATLRDAITEYIPRNLRACGDDPEAARRAQPAPATELMVAYVYDYIARVNPAGLLGMVHVLEGTSNAIATRAADVIGPRSSCRPQRSPT